jgi:hypothetical protein
MEDLVTRIRARFDHEAAKKTLREKYEAKMLFAYAGGMWQAGPELLTTCLSCPTSDGVLLDVYGTPVKVNVRELHALAQERWQEQMNAWLVEWSELQRQR